MVVNTGQLQVTKYTQCHSILISTGERSKCYHLKLLLKDPAKHDARQPQSGDESQVSLTMH